MEKRKDGRMEEKEGRDLMGIQERNVKKYEGIKEGRKEAVKFKGKRQKK